MRFSASTEPEWASRYFGLHDEAVAAVPDFDSRVYFAGADRQRLDALVPLPRPLMLQPINSWTTSLTTARHFGETIFQMEIPVDRVMGSAQTGFGCLNEQEFVIFDSAGLADLYMHEGVVLSTLAPKV